MNNNIPNVLCIPKKFTQEISTDFFSSDPLTLSWSPFPNLKSNRLYYLWLQSIEDEASGKYSNRLFHISSFSQGENNVLSLQLGNMFQAKRLPILNTNQIYQYKPLYEFGMQEIQPGVLTTIQAPIGER